MAFLTRNDHAEAAREIGRPAAQPPTLGPEQLARELEARGWNLIRAWRGVVSLGPPDPETVRSYPFKHGFRGGWAAHEADPSLRVDWTGPMLEAFQRFLQNEGLAEAPGAPRDVRALMTGFAAGVGRRAEVLQEAGIWPAEQPRGRA